MPGLSILVDVQGKEVQQALRRLDRGAGDLTPVFNALGLLMVGDVQDRMERGVDPRGQKWAPLRPSTKAIRLRRGWGLTPLIRTGSGQLFQSWSHRAAPDELVVGSSRIYAGTMHFGARKGAFGSMSNGSPIPWGNVPARNLLPDEAPEEQLDELLEAHFSGRAN